MQIMHLFLLRLKGILARERMSIEPRIFGLRFANPSFEHSLSLPSGRRRIVLHKHQPSLYHNSQSRNLYVYFC